LHSFYIYGNIETMDSKSAVLQLSSIAQEARLEIFRLLVQAGQNGLPAGKIGETLKIPASTLSFHLKELNHAGLINSRQESRFIYYSANYSAMNDLLIYLTENCCGGVRECSPDLTFATKEKELII
jgi:ArsR family transcriptional regulator, arsenate/arsenite/antimonite-responsive transcriptional repressor